MFDKRKILERFRCKGNGERINYKNRIHLDCVCKNLPKELINTQLITLLSKIKKEFPEMEITSGYRCIQHNEFSKYYCLKHFYEDAVKSDSKHCRGLAVDFFIPDFSKNELEYLVEGVFNKITLETFERSLEEIFWYKTYDIDEGRDPDNADHSEAYIHIQINDRFEKELISR